MPTPTFYIISFNIIISIIFYYKNKNSVYKYFTYFLFFTFIVELLSNINKVYYSQTNDILYSVNPIYNLYAIVTFIFYFMFYKHLFRKRKNRIRMNIFLFFYILFIPFDFFVLKTHFVDDFFINNIVFGSTLLIITLILFLIEIINNEEIVFNIKKSFIFWISVGALLFYIGVTPIIITSKYLNYNGLYSQIITVLNIIMYGCFIIGFIKSDPKYNY